MKGKGKKAAIYTLGCKANQADSDRLADDFVRAGFEVVGYREPADLYIVNTCTVTAKAAYQSRQAVRRFIRKNPGAEVMVMGCDVEVEGEVLEAIEGVSLVVGNSEKDNIPLSLRGAKLRSNPVHMLSFPQKRDDRCDVLAMTQRSRPFLKIQDGCENFCAYCIVPYVRGGLKSLPPDAVVSAIKGFHQQGFYEVVLTGIHIGAYGRDLEGGRCLTWLLEKILNETGIRRLRLSSIEPDEIGPQLIDLVSKSGGRICPHLHIPLQSGCDSTLRRMNRRYTSAQYERCIHDVKSRIPEINIGADVMTGFPGESDEEFQSAYRFIESLPVTYLHVFSYSDRKGTQSFRMPGKVGEEIKRARTTRLRMLSSDKRTEYLRSCLGREVTVVFDRNKVNDYWKGVSENYISVLTKDRDRMKNHHRVRLVDIHQENMIGEII